jgi:CheY-like chemotaxis protein
MSSTILLADDSLTIQKVVELTFADTDYEVIAVASGDDLLQRLPDCRPDIVICDVIMPGRDGYDVCQEIKSSPEWLHLPVILLTGTFEPFDRDRALAAGCSEIVTKPFEARKLVDAVERLAAAAAAPPAPPSFEDEPLADHQVTPPPPIMVPEELTQELEDTAVSSEYGFHAADDNAAETPPEPMVAPTDDGLDTVDFEAPEDHLAFDLMEESDTTAHEVDEPEPIPQADGGEVFQDFTADVAETAEIAEAADTVAAADLNEMMDGVDDEVFQVQPDTPEIEPIAADAAAGEPFLDEPSGVLEVSPPEVDPEHSKTTPINVASVMATGAAEEDGSEMDEDEISNAQTQDFEEPVDMREPAPVASEAPAVTEPEVAAPQAEVGLTDADVDRIAHRLLELAGDRIERIAWDVIPDMAEIVVRERVREIEDSTRSEAN